MQKISAKFPGKRILVVEDYFINQEIVQDMLEMMECSVELAEDGNEALEKHNEDKFDLILMDIQLPLKDGYEATQEIRQREKAGKPRTPIVALTANAMAGDREKCIDAGMDDYLSKPVEISKLEAILKKYIPE